jgi:cell volume regulation protein A
MGLTNLLVVPTASVFGLIPMFVLQMVLGTVLGYGLGKAMVLIINRLHLTSDGLYPVLTLALVLLTYSLTTVLGGNGFLAVYLAGLVLGKSDFIHKQSLMRFHDGIAWLMQIVMFITLGLLVFPSHLVPVIGVGLLIAAFLMFVARPISVFLSLLLSKMAFREKAMASWVGLRGAVPIILATFPLLAGVPQAETIFNLVFFIVLTSVLLQGTSLPLLARWLKVDTTVPFKPKYPLEFVSTGNIKSDLVEVEVPLDSGAAGKQIVELGLPNEVLIVLISRNGNFVVPRGSTLLQTGDRMLVLADEEGVAKVRSIVA